ncbi:YdaU family protein [Bartonella sp. B39]
MQHANQQETPHYESSRLPYVCWYQNDFLGGVRGMRAHEIGIYTILLNEMYARGRPLELSVERLARLCGCDKRTFVNVLEMLIEEGKILNLANGLWNKRCENVFHERAKLLEQKSLAGRSSAQKRKKINAKVQQLLNESIRDDKQSSESQKGEEKETPHGVSEKNFFLAKTQEEKSQEATAANFCFSPTPKKSSPHLFCKQEHGNSAPTFSENVKDTPSINEEGENLLCSHRKTENPTGASAIPQNSCIPHMNTEHISASSANTENSTHCTPSSDSSREKPTHSNSKTKSRTTTLKGTAFKGHRLSKDWQADIAAAVSEGLSEEQAHWQEKKFRDYWHAKSGKEALKVDWQATWRNWFRREIERIKEHQERLSVFSSHSPKNRKIVDPQYSDIDNLYKTLINYQTK